MSTQPTAAPYSAPWHPNPEGSATCTTTYKDATPSPVNPLYMPPAAMYGKAADLARSLGCGLGPSYVAILACAAGMGVHGGPIYHQKPTLYVAMLGAVGAGKSTVIERAMQTLPQVMGMNSTPSWVVTRACCRYTRMRCPVVYRHPSYARMSSAPRCQR